MDSALLEYEMKRRRITKAEACEAIGIKRSSFYRKLNGKSEFTLSEIQKLIELLDISDPMPIFFNKKVS